MRSRCATISPIIITLGEEERVSLSDFDVVLMRQDPPFDMGYITATHMLDHIHPTDAGGE